MRSNLHFSKLLKYDSITGLIHAVALNPKITPHILDFVWPHFKKFVTIQDNKFELNLRNLTVENGEEIVKKEHFGLLTKVVVNCLGHERRDPNKREIFEKAINSISNINLESLGVSCNAFLNKSIY